MRDDPGARLEDQEQRTEVTLVEAEVLSLPECVVRLEILQLSVRMSDAGGFWRHYAL